MSLCSKIFNEKIFVYLLFDLFSFFFSLHLHSFPVIFSIGLGRSGVAPITSIHQSTANNERQKQYKHVFYGLNISNSTSLMPTINKSPHFDPTTTNARNITVLQGENAFLVCSVMDLGKNFVSWLRHSDMNLLSVGKLKYTQDPRYHIFHTHDEHEDTWTLKVKKL